MPEVNGPRKEILLLNELRHALSDVLPRIQDFLRNDYFLIKWLEEYNWDLKCAESAFRKALSWRESNKIDSVLKEEFSDMAERFPYDNEGLDREGLPVLVVPMGAWNVKETVVRGGRDRFLRYVFQMLERNVQILKGVSERSGGALTQVIIIFDLHNFSFRQLIHSQTIATLHEWTKKSEEVYPRQLNTFCIINAPRIMPLIFRLFKPFMSTNTLNALRIFDCNQENWQKFIWSKIDPSQFPLKYGGTKKSKLDLLT